MSARLRKLREQEKDLNRQWLKLHLKAPKQAKKVRERYFRVAAQLVKEYSRIAEKTAREDRAGATKRALPIQGNTEAWMQEKRTETEKAIVEVKKAMAGLKKLLIRLENTLDWPPNSTED